MTASIFFRINGLQQNKFYHQDITLYAHVALHINSRKQKVIGEEEIKQKLLIAYCLDFFQFCILQFLIRAIQQIVSQDLQGQKKFFCLKNFLKIIDSSLRLDIKSH